VCVWPAEDYCRRLDTCGACAADPLCGWCEVAGCQPATAENAAACEQLRRDEHGDAVLWSTQNAFCPRCSRGTTCGECAAIPGCGWCHAAAKCISGAPAQRSKFLDTVPERRGRDESCVAYVPPGSEPGAAEGCGDMLGCEHFFRPPHGCLTEAHVRSEGGADEDAYSAQHRGARQAQKLRRRLRAACGGWLRRSVLPAEQPRQRGRCADVMPGGLRAREQLVPGGRDGDLVRARAHGLL
jgi:hypothetical protein